MTESTRSARPGPVISDEEILAMAWEAQAGTPQQHMIDTARRLLATFAERVAAKFMEADRGDEAPILWTPRQAARIVRAAAGDQR